MIINDLLKAKLFRLTHGNRGTMYSCLSQNNIIAYKTVKVNGYIVGWAALGWLQGEEVPFLGCYIDPRMRGLGLGKRAVRGLAKKIPEEFRDRDIHFAGGCETLYAPIGEAGFRAFASYIFSRASRQSPSAGQNDYDKEFRYGYV